MTRKDMTPEMTERFKAVEAAFAEMIAKNGWAAHYVPLNETHINCHTHGVEENLNHPDFQIVLPIHTSMANGLLHSIIDRVKAGQVFEEDKPYLGFMKEGYPISFKKFWECGREVMRILLCDANQLLPTDPRCNPEYIHQLDVLEEPGEHHRR